MLKLEVNRRRHVEVPCSYIEMHTNIYALSMGTYGVQSILTCFKWHVHMYIFVIHIYIIYIILCALHNHITRHALPYMFVLMYIRMYDTLTLNSCCVTWSFTYLIKFFLIYVLQTRQIISYFMKIKCTRAFILLKHMIYPNTYAEDCCDVFTILNNRIWCIAYM